MDLTAFEQMTIDLKPRTLADAYTITTLSAVPIGTAFTGTLCGWPWGCTIRGRTIRGRSNSAGRYQLRGDYDVSELLKRYITFDSGLSSASDIMAHVASQIGKTAEIAIDDHSVNSLTSETALADVISNLFGWTAAVPHRSVNIFLRAGVLHVLQRGKESGSYTLQNTGTPTFSEDILDTLMDESVNSPTITGDAITTSTTASTSFFSGTIAFGNASVTFAGGLCVQSVITDADGSNTTTTYQYSGNRYVTAETAETRLSGGLVSRSESTYQYGTYNGQPYLSQKNQNSYDKNNSRKTRTETNYYPLGFDFYGCEETQYSVATKEGTASESRKMSRSSVAEGRPGGQSSPYTISKAATSTTATPSVSIARNPIAASHIPVTDEATLQRYADGLTTLDGKTQITCQVECYDQHVVDYTEKVIYAGQSWYLDGNKISVSAQAVNNKQTLTLVRWY